jgi:hypothetical protein
MRVVVGLLALVAVTCGDPVPYCAPIAGSDPPDYAGLCDDSIAWLASCAGSRDPETGELSADWVGIYCTGGTPSCGAGEGEPYCIPPAMP